jgi:hypothetical protein
MRAVFVLILAAFLLSGCAGLTDPPLPTPLPTEHLPTAIALTVAARGLSLPAVLPTNSPEAVLSPDPSATLTPLAPDGTPPATATPRSTVSLAPTPTPTAGSPTPSATPTPPAKIPFAAVQILNPGPASRLTSPFNLHTFLFTGPKGLIHLTLYGEDGRVLMREIKAYGGATNQLLHVGQEIRFEIPGVAETGLLQVSVEDDHGRLMALNSLDLILLSVGDSDVYPADDQLENIYIQEPKPKALVQGGKLRVAGLARSHSDLPLLVEIRTDSGAVAGSRQVAVVLPAEGAPSAESGPTIPPGYGAFAVDVNYSVGSATPARLVVWERNAKNSSCQDNSNACILHLSSVEVMISP